MLILLAAMTAFQAAAVGPSFSCAHVTSDVNKMICASPSLSALDRELADVFRSMRGQPVDQKKLDADERAWLAAMLRECKDEACVGGRYKARIAELREQSRKAASPAAYEETQPFPAPEGVWAEARAMIGKACHYQPDVLGAMIPGFSAAANFLPVISPAGASVVRERQGTRFAFLVSIGEKCRVLDVVTLPKNVVGSRFLQCSTDEPPLNGFGVRNAGSQKLDGFWAVNGETRKLDRVPMNVLGITRAVRCQQPESGE